MNCSNCEQHGRVCDGLRPACGTCQTLNEIIRTWNRVPDSGETSQETKSLPSVIECSMVTQNVWAEEKFKELFCLDEEMQTLLPYANPKSQCGLTEAANAVFGIVLSAVKGEDLLSTFEECAQASQKILHTINSGSGTTLHLDTIVTVYLLNLFERYTSSSVGLARHFHLRGMRLLNQVEAPSESKQQDVLFTLKKLLIYHTALGSIFNFSETTKDLQPSYVGQCIDDIRGIFSLQRERDSVHKVPLNLFQLIYEMSFIRHKAATTGLISNETSILRNIRDRLQHYKYIDRNSRPTYGTKITELYRRVLMLFIDKMLNITMTCEDAKPQTDGCFEVLRTMELPQRPAIILPLLVLYFAVTAERRDDLIGYINNLKAFTTNAKKESLIKRLETIKTENGSEGRSPLIDILIQPKFGSLSDVVFY